MLQELLKQKTKPYHDHLEQLMFVDLIMDGSLTPPQYQQLLVTNYLSHVYFEEHVFNNLSDNLKSALQINDRIKLPALLTDIAELQLPIPQLPEFLTLKPITVSDASLMGALYVMEGATLGGHVIVKRLLNNVQMQPLDLNYHYYQLYGDTLITKWKQFCHILDSCIAPDNYDETIKGAIDMFENMIIITESISRQIA